MIQTPEEFASAVRAYAEAHNLSVSKLAERVGRPTQTVSDWLHKGLRTQSARNKVVQSYPWLFSKETASTEEGLAITEKPQSVLPTVLPKQASKPMNETVFLVQIELVRNGVVSLSDILQSFINSSPEDRNRFREKLGDKWKNFLELTRAMTGERALELALQERRVRSGNND